MAVTGLEDDYYCVHTPIPVEITPISGQPVSNIDFVVYMNGLQARPKAFNGIYYIDVALWISKTMNPFNDPTPYPAGAAVTIPNRYIQQITITFAEQDAFGEVLATQTATKYFVRCSQWGGFYAPPENRNVRAWKCYPFSWAVANNMSYQVLQGDTFTAPGLTVEYDISCCRGTLLKWLNEYGQYYYWLFPRSLELESSAEEIFRTTRNPFTNPRNSDARVDTVGFKAEKKMTVRDQVKEMYWHMFESLSNSPEVYVLREDWEIGTAVTPQNWWKIIQTKVEFTRNRGRRSTSDLEFEFELPEPYTQKRI